MRKLSAVILAVAGSVVPVAGPGGPASAAAAGFAVTRVIVGGRVMAVAADPATGIVYVGDWANQENIVAAIDVATNEVVATIGVPMFPRDVVVDPATDTVYAVGDGPAKVAVINGATDAVTTTISLPPHALPVGVAVNPGTDTLYVTDLASASVDVISLANDTITATVPLTNPVRAPHPGLLSIAVDTATNRIYVPDAGDNLVAVIDGVTNSVARRISLPAGASPRGVAVGSDAVYVADLGTNAITVIDTATETVSGTITGTAGITGVALGPAGTLYAAAPEGGPFQLGVTYVINTPAGNVTAQIPRGGEWVAVDSASAYLANAYDTVHVITPSSATTMCPVLLGPYGTTFTLGHAHQFQLTASAVPPASFTATGLPAGITLSPAGLLSGTPAAAPGGYQAMITAANGINPADTEAAEILVYQSPAITSPAHATFRTGTAGRFSLTATGWPAPGFTKTGALPRGVRLYRAGSILGTPAKGTGGRYRITLEADNGSGTTASQAFTLTVNQPPSFSSPDHVAFRAGIHKTFTIRTTGFPAARLAERGRLPRGISFRPGPDGAATLSGKALHRARGRTFTIRITARNGIAQAARQFLTITIK